MSIIQKLKPLVLVAVLALAIGCSGNSPTNPKLPEGPEEQPETFTDLVFQVVGYHRDDPTPGVPRDGRKFLEEEVLLSWRVNEDPRSDLFTVMDSISDDFMQYVSREKVTIQVSSRGTRVEFWLSDPWRWTGKQGSDFVAFQLFLDGREIGKEFLVKGPYSLVIAEYARLTIWPDGSFTKW